MTNVIDMREPKLLIQYKEVVKKQADVIERWKKHSEKLTDEITDLKILIEQLQVELEKRKCKIISFKTLKIGELDK